MKTFADYELDALNRFADHSEIFGEEPNENPIAIHVWVYPEGVLEARYDIRSTRRISLEWFNDSSEAAWCYRAKTRR